MTNVVLIDAGRSAVLPDDPDQPDVPTTLAADVIRGLLRRSRLRRAELTALFLAGPRARSTRAPTGRAGRTVDRPPLGLTTTVDAVDALSMARAVRAVRERPDVVAVVAATDPGTRPSCRGDAAAELHRRRRTARAAAARWGITPDEAADWARSSYTRADACSASGDFADEIVSTTRGYRTDYFHKPDTGDSFSSRAGDATPPGHGPGAERAPMPARPARGASALILTGAPNAARLGLRPRAGLRLAGGGRPGGLDVRDLDQLEVPELFAVTPLAWIKETGANPDVVNPRGGDVAFGHLPRSGRLRAMVTMLGSLEATGGRSGALVASDVPRSTAFVLTRSHGGWPSEDTP